MTSYRYQGQRKCSPRTGSAESEGKCIKRTDALSLWERSTLEERWRLKSITGYLGTFTWGAYKKKRIWVCISSPHLLPSQELLGDWPVHSWLAMTPFFMHSRLLLIFISRSNNEFWTLHESGWTEQKKRKTWKTWRLLQVERIIRMWWFQYACPS